jgi:hypothetical protein
MMFRWIYVIEMIVSCIYYNAYLILIDPSHL